MNVLGIGEVLWDVFPDEEVLGGAALNFCANVQRLGGMATLISGVGDDDRGSLAFKAMQAMGLDTRCVQTVYGVPTGVAVVQRDDSGDSVFHIPRPAAFDLIETNPLPVLATPLTADWIYFGTLLQVTGDAEAVIERLIRDLLMRGASTTSICARVIGMWN